MKQHMTASRLFILTVSGIISSLVGCSPEQTLATPPANTAPTQGGTSAAESSSSTATGGQGYPTAGGTTSESSSAPSQGGTNAAGGAAAGGAAAGGAAAGGAATGGKVATGGTGTKAATGGTKATTGGKTGAGGTKAATGGAVAGGDTSVTDPTGGKAATGGSAAAATTAAANSGTTVTFSSSGKATGAMSGWAYVAMGTHDVVTDPTCGTDGTLITEAAPCKTGTTWSADGLCVTGTAVLADTDYKDWGISIGVDATVTTGGTLGQSFSTITYTFSGTPKTGLRAIVSVGSTDYCLMDVASGAALELTSFTTTCYDSAKPGAALTAANTAKITKVMLQVPAGAADIAVSNLCLTGIKFGA